MVFVLTNLMSFDWGKQSLEDHTTHFSVEANCVFSQSCVVLSQATPLLPAPFSRNRENTQNVSAGWLLFCNLQASAITHDECCPKLPSRSALIGFIGVQLHIASIVCCSTSDCRLLSTRLRCYPTANATSSATAGVSLSP